MRVLSERPEANVEEVAAAAAVTRQTVYAHYPSREALLNAAIDHVSAEAIAAMDAAELDQGPPEEALLRFLAAGWRTFERYPLLLRMSPADPRAEHDRNQPVMHRLEQLIRRGQESGAFDPTQSPAWLADVAISLGHLAGEQAAAGRMTLDEAAAAVRHSVMRLFRRTDSHGQQEQAERRADYGQGVGQE